MWRQGVPATLGLEYSHHRAVGGERRTISDFPQILHAFIRLSNSTLSSSVSKTHPHCSLPFLYVNANPVSAGGASADSTSPPTLSAPDEIVSTTYFRTADGRSLFAESLAVASELSSGHYRIKSADSHYCSGWSDILGSAGPRKGTPAPAGLGLDARQRRARISSKHRDEKWREQSLAAKKKLERLNYEVSILCYRLEVQQ